MFRRYRWFYTINSMKHGDSSTEQSRMLCAQIKAIEHELMYNKNTICTLSDLEALTNKFLEITKPVSKPNNFNSNQNLM